MRRLSFGYGARQVELKIETPEGTVRLTHRRDDGGDYLGSLVVEVVADGCRFAGERPRWAKTRSTRGGALVVVQAEPKGGAS